MWIWPFFRKKWKREAKGLHRLQRQHLIERKRNLDFARKSFSKIVLFFPFAAMLEFEKLNLSGATNVMSQVVKTILIL